VNFTADEWHTSRTTQLQVPSTLFCSYAYLNKSGWSYSEYHSFIGIQNT